MPQKSIAYAVGRVRVLERNALDESRIERLLATASYEEAMRLLQEIGWASQESTDHERIADQLVEKASALIREISPAPAVTDCFLLRHDVHNLKMLLKARCLGTNPAYLSACGTIPVSVLSHAVAERQYKALPEALAEALADIEKKLSVREDPLAIDSMLDQALYNQIFVNLAQAQEGQTARRYFQTRIDLLNALMMLRVRAMGRDSLFLSGLLLTGGSIPPASYLNLMEHPERLPALLAGYGRPVFLEAQKAVQSTEALPGLERAMDDALIRLFVPYRYAPLALEPVIGYLLAREREAAAIRLILAGKANGFPQEAVRERLRGLYGQ